MGTAPGPGVMSRSFTHTFPHHSTQILEQLNVQRYYAAFCDVTVRVDDVDFKLHKCVLAAASAKMQGMLFNMRPECGNILSLKDVSLNGFKCIVEYMYTGAVKLDALYVHEILGASQFFEIREIEKFCLDFFKTPLAPPMASPSNGVTCTGTDAQLPPIRTALQGILNSNVSSVQALHHHPSVFATSYTASLQPPFTSPPFAPPMPHPLAVPAAHITAPHPIAQQPANVAPPVGTAGSGFDANYIEDYLKLIETLHGDPNQPPAQQTVAAATVTPTPTAAAVPYSKPVQRPLKQQTQTVSYLDLSTPPAKTSVPITQYSAEDVRRTVMNVLSQERFDDDDDTGSISRPAESVPLTALLDIGSEKKLNNTVETSSDLVVSDYVPPNPETSQTTVIEVSVEELKHEVSGDSDEDNLVVNEEDTSSADDGDELEDKYENEMEDEWVGKQEGEQSLSKSTWEQREANGRQKRKKNTPVKLAKQKADASESEEDVSRTNAGSGNYKHYKMSTYCTRPLKKRKLRSKSSKKTTTCDKCGREFGKRDMLERHMAMHSTTAMFSCHICGHKYARVGELTRHMRSHALDEYECDLCKLRIRSPALFKRHMELMHGESRAFCCMASGCTFRSDKPSGVEKHAAIHADVKAYVCPECSRTFAQPNGLRSHLRSCQQQRRYLCDICGAKFNHLQSMKSHRMLHTGEKPYMCRDCNARFTDHRNFKRHRRIHDNLYPYSCTHCDKRFRHSNSLKAHISTHTNSAHISTHTNSAHISTHTNSAMPMESHDKMTLVQQSVPIMMDLATQEPMAITMSVMQPMLQAGAIVPQSSMELYHL